MHTSADGGRFASGRARVGILGVQAVIYPQTGNSTYGNESLILVANFIIDLITSSKCEEFLSPRIQRCVVPSTRLQGAIF
jgi:hypothetical protein